MIKWKLLNRVRLFATPWTRQAMEFSRPGDWLWVVIPFSRGSSQPRDRTHVFCTAGGFFTREALQYEKGIFKNFLPLSQTVNGRHLCLQGNQEMISSGQ